MNLHEECLLKYLLNPLGVAATTELLKMNNDLIAKTLEKSRFLAKAEKLRYSTNSY